MPRLPSFLPSVAQPRNRFVSRITGHWIGPHFEGRLSLLLPSSSFSLKELSPAQPYETDRPRERRRGDRRGRRTEEGAFVREEGGKGGGLFVAAVVVRFSHCVPSCDIRLNGRRTEVWPDGAPRSNGK